MAFIFKDQVEALAGSTSGTQAERWFDDGIKDVISRFAALRPELMHLFSSISSISSGAAIDISATHRVLSVIRNSKLATEIPSSDRFYAADTTSLRRATEEFPVYYVRNSEIGIIPTPTGSAQAYADLVNYGAVTNWDTNPSSIANFPTEFYRMPVLFAACKVLEERMVGYQGLPPNLSLPSVPVLALPTLPDAPTLVSVPVAPIVNLSLVSTLTTVVMPDDVSLPVFTPVPDPSISDLDLSGVTPPTPPEAPAFVIGDAELQEAYTTQTLTLGGTAPVYTPPVMTTPDWSDANEWVSDATKGEDPEMVAARMQVINGQVQEFATNLQNSLNKFNEDNTKYQADNQSDTAEFQQNTQGLIQKMSVSTNVDLQNKAQELQKQVQEYANKMQRYQAELSKYQADLNELVVLWTSNEMQVEFAKWQMKFQQELGVFQAKVGAIIQEYQADISKKSSLAQAEVAAFSAELQKESTKISSDINKYQAAIGGFTAEIQSQLNLYSTETQSKLSVYTQEAQTKLNAYGQEVQALVQDFTTQMQKAQAEYQWMQAQLQYCMGEYEKSFASYQPQQQGE